MATHGVVDPIVKTLSLNASAQKAFDHFTKNIHVWWPVAEHSLSKDNIETVIFEAHTGGRIYEIEKSGKEREWGRVINCEAPNRIVFSWVLEAPDKATEIELLFKADGAEKTTFTLIHRGWENRADGVEWRGYYNEGWDGVLGGYNATIGA